MNDSQAPAGLSKREHLLTFAGSVLVGFGAVGVFGHGMMIHPALTRPELAWTLFLLGLGLSAYVSVSIVLRLSRAARSGQTPPAKVASTNSLSKTKRR